jgi:hypothetical protein
MWAIFGTSGCCFCCELATAIARRGKRRVLNDSMCLMLSSPLCTVEESIKIGVVFKKKKQTGMEVKNIAFY